MRKLSFLTLVLFCCSYSAAWAQTDYEGWLQKARTILGDPVADKTGINQKWELGLNKVRGAQALVEAAKLAPDDTKKFDAYYEAGELFRGELKSESAAKAYGAARDIAAGPAPKRAEAGYYAAINFQQFDYGRGKDKQVPAEVIAEYEKALAIGGAPADTRAKIHEKYAYYLGTQQKFWEAALNYEKAADLTSSPADRTPSPQDQLYYNANSNASKLPPSPQTRAFAEAIYKKQVAIRQKNYATKPGDYSISLMMLRHQHARRMLDQGVPERAFALWKETAADTNLEKGSRYAAWKEIADEQMRQKLWSAAVKSWDGATQIPDLPWIWFKEATTEKAEAYASQNDYKNARAQYETLLASPLTREEEKIEFKFRTATLHGREAKYLRPSKPALASAAKAEASKIYDAMLAAPTTSLNVQVNVIKQKAQMELDGKNYASAIQTLNDSVSRFDQAPDGYGKHLLNTIARIYISQNQFVEAVESLKSSALYKSLPDIPVADVEARTLILTVFDEVAKAKNWELARSITMLMGKWRLDKFQTEISALQVDIETGDFAAGRNRVSSIERMYLAPDQKKKLEEWKLKIPAT